MGADILASTVIECANLVRAGFPLDIVLTDPAGPCSMFPRHLDLIADMVTCYVEISQKMNARVTDNAELNPAYARA